MLPSRSKKDYVCPFCGNIPNEKQYFWEKVKSIGVGLTVPATETVPITANVKIDKKSNPKPEKYYDCNGCNMKYRDASGFDVNIIITNLKVKGRAIKAVQRYYSPKKITITELLTNHVTGIARKPRHLLSFLEDKLVKNRLYIGFSYMGIRTYGTFAKIKEDTIEHYELQSMGVP